MRVRRPSAGRGGGSAWPIGNPVTPGTFGQAWRALYRPGIDGLSKDGLLGPSASDEFAAVYAARAAGGVIFGTAGSPVTITYDRVAGWHSSGGAIPGANSLTEAGLPTLKNCEIVGSIVLDGVSNQIGQDVTLTATPQDVTVQGNPTRSSVNNLAAGGFPTTGGPYYVMMGGVLCQFDAAATTPNRLTNVRTVDGQTHLIFAGEYANWVDATGKSMVAARMRNVRVMAPVAAGLTRAQSALASIFQPTVPLNSTLSVAIVAGASPATITLASVTSFPASGTVLVGDDFVTYTSKTGGAGGTLNGCTWPAGGATAAWASGYFVFGVDGYTLSLVSAASFPAGPGVVELDGSLEVHYQAKSGNTLTGCAVASRWSSTARAYPVGLDVRTCVSDEKAEVSDPTNLYGQIAVQGARLDARDCVHSYSSKGPGAIRFLGTHGSKLDRHYGDFNWYDLMRVANSTGLLNITRSVFVNHPGTGNTGAPHVDGVQGWHVAQLDGTPVLADCAFLGSLTNAHEFWNSEGTTTGATESNLPAPSGLYFQNCLLASSQAGSSNGKGALIDGSIGCGAKNCWYDASLFQTIGGPNPSTTVPSAVSAGATSIPLAATANFVAAPVTTTLTGDVTVTKDTSFAVILATLALTDATSMTATRPCFIVLSDGTKSCCLRADFRSTNTLTRVRWMNGTPGTYTAAATTVYCGTANANGLAQIPLDAQGRLMVVAFTAISGGALTGVKACEYAIPSGTLICPFDNSHPPPVQMTNTGNVAV